MRNLTLILRELVWSAIVAAVLLALAVVLAVVSADLRELATVLALAGIGSSILSTNR